MIDQALLTVQDLEVEFASKGALGRNKHVVKAVNGVSFSINKGDTFGIDSALVTIECTAQNGDTVNLVDFDSAGWNDQFYVSWLPVVKEKEGTFSKDNPLRLIRTAR